MKGELRLVKFSQLHNDTAANASRMCHRILASMACECKMLQVGFRAR